MDTQILLIPFISPGVKAPSGTRVHSGFLTAWNSIALQVIAIVSVELAAHPDHSLVTTGHSLGGSLAALAAIALQQNFPQSEVRTYSYGAPRTGNRAFADFMKDQLGPAAYRVVHTNDGVPTMIPVSLGYHHHGVEYWQREDPATELTTIKLSDDGEDPNGSASIPSHGINRAHVTYLGVAASTPFCF
ncbi:Alpha/Beta hydrolase protein [Infundibulicybe gibba]|nr:Alpha/Beta hydrolase protein [Infundibulicybe gibba]